MRAMMLAAAAAMMMVVPAEALEPVGVSIPGATQEQTAKVGVAIQHLFEACPGLAANWLGVAKAEAVYWPTWNGPGHERHGWRTAADLFITLRDHTERPASLIEALAAGSASGYQPGRAYKLRFTLGAGDQPGMLADGTVEQALCAMPLDQPREDGDFFHAVDGMNVLR